MTETSNMRRGFTMIELVFVIVIIGILAAVAIPKLAGTSTEAKKALFTAFVGTMNRTVGPTMYAKAIGAGQTSIASAAYCGDWATFTEAPTGVTVGNDCKIVINETTSGIPKPTSGAGSDAGGFTDSNATSAPRWAKPVW